MKAIEFDDVSFAYDKDSNDMILNHVSFCINVGEHVSLIGSNGTGKSSIAKLMIGLLEPLSGKIHINEKNHGSKNKSIGYVFQNPDNQFIGVTVADDVAFGLENRKVPFNEMDPIIDRVLEDVDMLKYKKYEPTKLSGGQKQRVAIASNLALDLSIIIFDESTSMLDPVGKNEIINIIKKLKELNPNLTIIQITHDMDECLNSNRVLLFENSEIKYDGNPRELFVNEDIMTKYSIKPPFMYDLVLKLKKIGLNVDFSDSEESIRSKINAYKCK